MDYPIIVVDDGANEMKAARMGDTRDPLRFPAAVAPLPRTLDPEYLARPGVQYARNGSGTTFLVGSAARTQGTTASYDVSNYRYFSSPETDMRFAAAVGSLLPPGEHTIRLVVGANVEAYRQLRSDIDSFYRRTHRFSYRDQAYIVHVDDVLITHQPRGALAAVMRDVPTVLQARTQTIPLERATIILVDIGGFTTDVVASIVMPGPDGMEREEVADKSFALRFGVQDVRQAVSEVIQDEQGITDVPLWLLDTALQSGTITSGTGELLDISDRIQAKAAELWQPVYNRIRSRLEAIRPHYL